MSRRLELNRFTSAASRVMLGVMLLRCTPPIHASGDWQNTEPNNPRWDLAEDFEFRWTAVELSAKVLSGATSNSLTRTLIVSAEGRGSALALSLNELRESFSLRRRH